MTVYCGSCDRHFSNWHAYKQHDDNSSLHQDPYCLVCNKSFDSWWALMQHFIQSSSHFFCRKCEIHFEYNHELNTHCINQHDYCERCERFFKNAAGLHNHNRQSHPYCEDCRRVFNSESNLRAHLRSSLHQPKNVPCAFQHRGCTLYFVSKSAMILHLESGACTSGATRAMIDRWIRVQDSSNVITVPRQLLTNGEDTPRYFATQRSWNGSAYECVLCHNTFRTLDDLNRHLASPRHQEKAYRCPLSSCLARFNTLSGLCQHVESESCGVLRFRMVREGMDILLRDMHRLRITASNNVKVRYTFKVRDGFPKASGWLVAPVEMTAHS